MTVIENGQTTISSARKRIKVSCFIDGHGDFALTLYSYKKGNGCPKCNDIKILDNYKKKASIIHNGQFCYSKINSINWRTKVDIICKKCNREYTQYPQSHLQGYGCRYCSYKKRRCASVEIKNRFIKIHGNKNDYSLMEYINYFTSIKIICLVNNHGIYEQLPHVHLKGHGCPKCAALGTSVRKKFTADKFIYLAKKIHGDLYDYSLVTYLGMHIRVKIFCSNHGIFEQKPGDHINDKNGCPKCRSKGFSKISIKWLDYMAKRNNIFIRHHQNQGEYKIPTTRWLVDGYCEETNTIFEFHGSYWHGDPRIYNPDKINGSNKKSFGELYQKTLEREMKIKALGYNYISIWESDFKKMEKSANIIRKFWKSNNLK